MDLLRRYQKAGGFLQLVQLIETCAPQKQAQLLGSVEKESVAWANEVRAKILSIDRIFGWDEQPLAEIVSRLQELTLSVAVHGIDKTLWEKATKTLSHGQKRRIDDLSKTKDPTPGEITSSYMKIIAEVRDMINQGYVHLPSVDPGLIIEEDIEDRLSKSPTTGITHHSAAATPTIQPPSKPLAAVKGSDQELGMEVAKLRHENQQLRQQVQVLSNELSAVRSIVATVKKAVA
ncbi:MAG: hypothetical protein H6624_15115 [Bdellovibrionaceae bacterium]|nr:hypothetical protein [Bdellovibrionales bacterium]MCB9085675.1 hypothetical protein [Pseudobdellovibrionaceae bacterium]